MLESLPLSSSTLAQTNPNSIMADHDRIGPDMNPKKSMADRMNIARKTFLAKDGLIGEHEITLGTGFD